MWRVKDKLGQQALSCCTLLPADLEPKSPTCWYADTCQLYAA